MLFFAQYCSIYAFVNELWDTEFYNLQLIASKEGRDLVGFWLSCTKTY
jgi:hypothetical protein